jgi:DNA polymerase
MPDLTAYERRTWLVDQTINARGVQVDTDALADCIYVMRQAEKRYTLELCNVTGGSVGSVSEVARIGVWLRENGLSLPDLKAETVAEALERDDLPSQCKRVLQIRSILGGANVKKLYTLDRQVNSDGRLRDQYTYCGADRTGRASAGGVQLQNLTGDGPTSIGCRHCGQISGLIDGGSPSCPRCGSFDVQLRDDWTVEAVEFALADIKIRDLDHVIKVWGDPADVITGCLRGLLIAKPGHDLVCCDFSAIEAVIAAVISRCQWRIDVFNGDGKIYEASAAKATGIPLAEILQHKRDTGQHHPARKTIGKVRELANGYGGWIGANKNFGADKFMTDEEIKADVLAWRAESPEIVEMWGGQFIWCGPGRWDYRPELHGLEGAAIQAIRHPDQWFGHNDIGYIVANDVLHCQLPSGRFLHYHQPRLVATEDKLHRGPAVKITFWGYNTDTTKGPVGWILMETYGGRLFENVCQAIGADFEFEALARLEDRGYPIVMHTHDEGTAEVPSVAAVDGSLYSPAVLEEVLVGMRNSSIEEMAAIMSERPTWAANWPIKAAGWRHKRYQK